MKTLDDKVVVITGAGSGIGRALAARPGPPRRAARDLRRRRRRASPRPSTWSRLPAPGGPQRPPRRRRPRRLRGVRRRRGRAVRPGQRGGQQRRRRARRRLRGHRPTTTSTGSSASTSGASSHGTKEFLPHLIASGDGHLVNISSLFGLISMPGQSAYNATKYAVRGFTEALREEMLIAGHPVGVTCVHPGGIKTAHRPQRPQVSEHEDKAADREALRQEAGPDDAREGRRDHRQGHPAQQGAGAGRHRRARPAPLREAHRLALPGRRRPGLQAGAAGR